MTVKLRMTKLRTSMHVHWRYLSEVFVDPTTCRSFSSDNLPKPPIIAD